MVQIRDMFGQPVCVPKRSRGPTTVPIKTSGESRPCEPELPKPPTTTKNRRSRGEHSNSDKSQIKTWVRLSKNRGYTNLKKEVEDIVRRISVISTSGVLEKVEPFLREHPNYHPVQVINLFDGYKKTEV